METFLMFYWGFYLHWGITPVHIQESDDMIKTLLSMFLKTALRHDECIISPDIEQQEGEGLGWLVFWCWQGFRRVQGDAGVSCYVHYPHVSWPGHFYWDSLPTELPTLLLINASWRALHIEPTSGKAGNREHFPFFLLLLFSTFGWLLWSLPHLKKKTQ